MYVAKLQGKRLCRTGRERGSRTTDENRAQPKPLLTDHTPYRPNFYH